MNMDDLSSVEFGNVEGLQIFLFENAQQHKLFQETLLDQGLLVPTFNLYDADVDNLDDWLLPHQVEHQAFANYLDLNNPFNLLDVDWNNEAQFYDWLSSHLYIHQQIAASMGLT
jgi:hypothetical protein